MTASHKIKLLVKDPQSWISAIAVLTLLGLCLGSFEPREPGLAEPYRQKLATTEAEPWQPEVQVVVAQTRTGD